MSAVAVYFILQLDAIRMTGGLLLFILCFVMFVRIFCAVTAAGDGDNEAYSATMKPWMKRHVTAIFVLILLSGLIPNSGTAAAIYIVPKFVKGDAIEQVAKDGGEIYALGMARLKALLGDVEKAKPTEEP